MAAHAAFLRDEVLLHNEAAPALGLSLHLADIALPELRAACEEGGAAAPVPWPALKVSLPDGNNPCRGGGGKLSPSLQLLALSSDFCGCARSASVHRLCMWRSTGACQGVSLHVCACASLTPGKGWCCWSPFEWRWLPT